MRIHLLSDLHLEFAPFAITNLNDADILVLSGDILVAERFRRGPESPYYGLTREWLTCLEVACTQYELVYLVLGNHEHYHGNFQDSADVLRNALDHIDNLIILDNQIAYCHEFIIVGTSLWGDFNNSEATAMIASQGLNDYKLVQQAGYRKLRPATTAAYFDRAINLIQRCCTGDNKVLVFSHHAPSYRSITPEYAGSPNNPGYASHLDEFIRSNPQIKLWTHGHMHSSHDYDIGSTRILANPRGYASKDGSNPENKTFDPHFTFEV